MKRKKQAKTESGADSKDDKVFKALANQDRRVILDGLRGGPQTTQQLCQVLPGLDRCTVMQHLRVLDESGLIIVKREGRYRWNYLNVAPIQGIYSRWIKDFAAPAAKTLHQLKASLEN